MPTKRRRRRRGTTADAKTGRRRTRTAAEKAADVRRSLIARARVPFQQRGPGGRFGGFTEGFTQFRQTVKDIPLATADSFDLRELSGHRLLLEAFSPESAPAQGALFAAAEVVVEAAREYSPSPERGSPYSLGSLQQSIQAISPTDFAGVRVIATGGSPSIVTGRPRDYAAFVERGGRLPSGRPTRPQPFLEPAFLNTRQQQADAAADHIRRVLLG